MDHFIGIPYSFNDEGDVFVDMNRQVLEMHGVLGPTVDY